MKIAIFGATGGTGRALVEQALAMGHPVTCLVRDPTRMASREGITTMQGDARDADAVAQVVAGQDAVLSALGSASLKENDLLDRASANILRGMQQHGVRRLIVLGAAGASTGADKYMNPLEKLMLVVLRATLLKYPFQDQAAQERHLEASDVDYTIVRPPRLTNGPRTARYRVQLDGLPKDGSKIARADVADFMLKQLMDPTFIRRGPFLAD